MYSQLRDVELTIKSGKDLPRMDYVGHCDPYLTLEVTDPNGHQLLMYKTAVCYNTANPVWNEEILLKDVPFGTVFNFRAVDKDHLTQDDLIGTCELRLDPTTGCGSADGSMQLAIRPAKFGRTQNAGCLVVAVRHGAASCLPGSPQHCGPVRYRISSSTLAGALTGHIDANGSLAFPAYKLTLTAVPHFFPQGASVHWNTQYDNAKKIFENPVAISAVRTQHSYLYADSGQKEKRGLLRGGGDLVSLLRGGVRGGQRRYYTYTINRDGSMCFSETGATLSADFMSKHAMHANCDEKVIYAGEFCLVPPGLPSHPLGPPEPFPRAAASEAELAEGAARHAGGDVAEGWSLVIDNNSGTYAPPPERLPAVAALLMHNLPGLRIETVNAVDERGKARLRELHARIPSRLRA